MALEPYLIDHTELDWNSLLQSWQWLLPEEEFTVWFVNRFGDLFIVLADGSVHVVDIGCGAIDQLASSRDEFADLMDDDDNANEWLLLPLVDELVAGGVILPAGHCYSYRRPPVLGGDYVAENILVMELIEHYDILGALHEEIQDIPDGAEIDVNWTDP